MISCKPRPARWSRRTRRPGGGGPRPRPSGPLGAKDCTPEIDTSEIDRGFSVAFSNGLSVAFSDEILLVSGIFQRIGTCPVDVH